MEMECVFMRVCPNCGRPAEDDAMFCSSCGTAIPAPKAVEQNVVFCPNCGEKLPAGSAFCPNCGAAIGSESAAAPKKKGAGVKLKPRVIGIAAVVALVAVLAVSVRAVSGLFSSPAKKFISYQRDLFVSGFLSHMESGLDKIGSRSFSTDLTITASVDEPSIDYYLSDSSISLGVDLKKNSLVAGGEVVVMGSPVLSGTATYENGKAGFLLPQADNNYYVMDLSQVIKNLTGEDVDFGVFELPEISGKQWRSLAEAYLDIAYSTITKDNLEVEKNKSVRLSGLGGGFTGTVYTFKPTAEDIEGLVVRLADHLEKDKDLRKLLLQLIGSEGMVQLMNRYSFEDSDIEEELDEALQGAAEELRDEAEWIGRQVESSGFTWVLAVEGKDVRQIRLSARNGGSALVYEANEGAESGRRNELLYAVSYNDKQNLVENSYIRKGDHYDGCITFTIPYEDSVMLNYDLDLSKKSVFGIPYGEYRLSVPGEGASIRMEVAAGAKGGVDHTISISADSYYFDYMFSRLTLTVNATDRGSVNKPSQRPVDISDYSAMEFYELFSGIGNTLEDELLYNSPLSSFAYGW